MSISFHGEITTTVEAEIAKHPLDDGIASHHPASHSERIQREAGLRLTLAQVARVWRMECHMSERLLGGLALPEFLLKNKEGAYLRASGADNADQ
jgi:hypothetical protein